MKLDKDDYLVDMCVIRPYMHILTISENGFGKRSDPADYRVQSRAGKGLKAGKFDEKTGKLVNMKQVKEDQDIILMTESGNIIRIQAKDVNIVSRNTKGVIIMRLREKTGKIVCASITEHEEEPEAEQEAEVETSEE